MNKQLTKQTETGQTFKDLSREVQEKRAILADFLREICLIANRPISQELAECYWARISHFPPNQLRKGLEKYISTENRWPWPSDLVDYVEGSI